MRPDGPWTWDEQGRRVPLDEAQRLRLRETPEGAGVSNQPEPIDLRGLSRRQRRNLKKHYSPNRIIDPYFLEEIQKQHGCPLVLLLLAGLMAGVVYLALWIVRWLQ